LSIKLFFGNFGGFILIRDFTVRKYSELLDAFKDAGYEFKAFRDFLKQPLDRVVILRHDVDKLPLNSLNFAKIEKDKGLNASYFFRSVPVSFKPSVIRAIQQMGHEIGYHYEVMDQAKGEVNKALEIFIQNLDKFKKVAKIETICMHGSPMSKYDNRELWKKFHYYDYGIIGEPYFDIDYSKVLYLTDTGRSWNSEESNIRDKVVSPFHYEIKNSDQLIELILKKELPNQIMLNTHPQRCNDDFMKWGKELVWQNVKNQVKRLVSHRLHR